MFYVPLMYIGLINLYSRSSKSSERDIPKIDKGLKANIIQLVLQFLAKDNISTYSRMYLLKKNYTTEPNMQFT